MAANACPHCGNALGSKEHEEDCTTPTRPIRRKTVPTGPVPESVGVAAEMGTELLRQLRERRKA